MVAGAIVVTLVALIAAGAWLLRRRVRRKRDELNDEIRSWRLAARRLQESKTRRTSARA